MAKYSREHPEMIFRLNDSVTFGYCSDEQTTGCDDVFFNLRRDSCDARFTVTYRRKQYSVANYDSLTVTAQQEFSCPPSEAPQ